MNRRIGAILVAFFLAVIGHAEVLSLEGWKEWSPRPAISPRFQMNLTNRSLQIRTSRASDFGAWKRDVYSIQGGAVYRFGALYQADNVPNETRSVIPRLEWRDSEDRMVRPPEYTIALEEPGEWRQVELITTAPTNATSVEIQLGFGFAERAGVSWKDITLELKPSVPNRTVRAVTIFHRPRNTRSAAESVEQFCVVAGQSASHRPDVLCLPEGITVVGTGKSYWDVSESLPGPTTERLGRLAREMHCYIVGGIYERVGDLVYNTAVLIGRDGKLVGKYRKTHLPREEWEAGITPGDSYPVFDTDFGKVGLIVCWDLQFPEPSRSMARQGAEILLLPIWGGNETLARARAIENHVFLLSSSYDMKTFILDPVGAVLAEASSENPIAFAELPLDKKYYQPWLGDMKHRTWKERRPDIAIDPR